MLQTLACVLSLLCFFTAESLQQTCAAEVDFSADIRPVLARRCYACHGPAVQEAGLGLHEFEAATKETESGTFAIVPGKWDESELAARVLATDADLRMPPGEHEPLKPEEIELLKAWVNQGAEYNQHWAFQPVPQVEIPPATGASQHPIDRFIDAQLKQKGLQAAPQADWETLLRRLYYDLIGLPPTPEEVADFVADASPQAYENVVDKLLASPHYGERWGRHWLDVVRYAETNSFERDGAKPNAWKFRDYVINSFNEDKPYDQFLREQLAGDELADANRETLIASGFYRLGIWDDEPADPLLARYDELDSIVTTIGQGMLGLTINCARCHEHKIDPMPQEDYYKLVAFLNDLTPYATRSDAHTFSQTDISSEETRLRHAQLEEQLKALRQRMYELEQTGVVKMEAADQRASETRQRGKLLRQKLRDYLSAEDWARYEIMKQEERGLQGEKNRLPAQETVLSVAQINPNPEQMHLLMRGNPHVPGDPVSPGFPELFAGPEPEFPASGVREGRSGNRIALANWITSPDNRLTSRVMVNRIWQHHFGRGIVRTPNNFGLLGAPPTHPDLLNWLATEFVHQGWRMKSLHKLIVTSEAYKRSSTAVESSLAQDPNNDNFWRFDLRRLSAEEVRDSVLAVTGSLNLSLYGPSIYPELSPEVLATQSKPGDGWGKSSPEDQNRRSVYIFIKRSLIPPELTNFDFPDTDVTCEGRFLTIQPSQALAMMNGSFLNEQSARFADRLRSEAGNERNAQVKLALELVSQHTPATEDINDGLKLMEQLQQKHQLSEEESLRLFCLYALNLNSFLFVD